MIRSLKNGTPIHSAAESQPIYNTQISNYKQTPIPTEQSQNRSLWIGISVLVVICTLEFVISNFAKKTKCYEFIL